MRIERRMTMWTIECHNNNIKNEVHIEKVKGKIDAAIRYQSLINRWDNVAVFDEDNEYVDPCEL